VGKVFDPEVKAAQVEREIDAVERAARLEFAPQVLSSNLAERWYEEELVEGVPGLPPGDLPHGVHVERFLEFFHREVLPCLEKVVLLEGVRFQDLGPYTDALSAAVTEERTDGGGSPERQAKVAAVRAYMASARSQLMAASDHDVLLQRVPVVFSHGDFEQNNLLRTKTGVRIIDWEAAGERSILYDLYNFFFYEIYCGRIEGSIVPQIDQAIAALVAHIEKQHPLLEREFLTHSSFSRRLFYLEWLCMVLGRDYKDKNLDVALRMIATYERFEKNAEQASPVASAAGQKCR
jgi:thiamine kinase-like enzyme